MRVRNSTSGTETFQMLAGGSSIALIGFLMQFGAGMSLLMPNAMVVLGLATVGLGAWTAYRPSEIVIDATGQVVRFRGLMRERTISFRQIHSLELRLSQISFDDLGEIFDVVLLLGDGTRFATHSALAFSVARMEARHLADVLHVPVTGERDL